ncbi:rhodanese-like domain-containing protein [Parabacteroides sp. 52]|uniref:rhodanese-like domain-containing protein n=1 Tax=unclassified Parabacteroides TaxID=2649774 RepID=UPI0013D59E86|nr:MULTISPECIES: rhodanese-like domain-containing protein [unclassified Parabacteroides]MDH6534307.1 phage shock protein E [Parabacteroides sp. PM5-20]NDV54806.1 rhodanese-like domain-containing protein [Parabacteroides sp. 52]
MAGFFNRLFGLKDKADFNTLLENGATLLDVRTAEEYKQGAAAHSINIPLDSLSENISKLEKDKPIITVCASGMRSRSAASLLRNKGFAEVYNGGSWFNF